MSVFTYNYKIKYSDIGTNNKLTLKALISILQEAATEHSEEAGYSINNINITNSAWLVLNWKAQMLLKPHLNELLTIKTWPRTFDKIYSYRDFEVFDSKNNLVAIATSKWLLIDSSTKKIKKLSTDISKAYGGIYNKCVFNTPVEEKVNFSYDKLDLSFDYVIQRRDLDTNGHVNNLHYIDFAFESLPEKIYINNDFNNLEIIYKKEIKYKDTINCYYFFDNNINYIIIQNRDNTVIHSIIKLS